MTCRPVPKLNSLNTCVIVQLLRFLISDLCLSWNFSSKSSTSFGNFQDVKRGTWFLVLNLLLELFPMSRLTSHKTRSGNRSVVFQSHAGRPQTTHVGHPILINRYPRSFECDIQDSSGTVRRRVVLQYFTRKCHQYRT